MLVRRGADLPNAFRQSGDYIFDQGESVGFSLIDRTIECTKTTLGLKLFLSLAWAGERGLGDYVASRYELARRFHAALSRQPGISCPYVPESNILCFQVDGVDQLTIRDRMLADGRLHIGTTTINGKRHLRIVIMAPDTDESTLDHLLRTLQAARVPTSARAEPGDPQPS